MYHTHKILLKKLRAYGIYSRVVDVSKILNEWAQRMSEISDIKITSA